MRNPLFGLMLIICASLSGCSGDGRPPVYKAGGKVSFQGKPASKALVVFHPMGKEFENGPKPVATCTEDGGFTLTTFAQDDGAPSGDYLVTVVWNQPVKEAKFSIGEGGNSADKLGGKYGNPKSSQLKFSVTKPGPNNFDLDLK